MSGATKCGSKEFTKKQKEYLRYLALDFDNAEIAKVMNIKEGTVYIHYQQRILLHTRLQERSQLVAYAKQQGYGEQNNE